MSRVSNNPVELPKDVEVVLGDAKISIKGKKGELAMDINPSVEITKNENSLTFAACSSDSFSRAMSGTTRALVNNMVTGVSEGFVTKLDLVGVGYRVQVQGNSLNLTLGFSHPVVYELPEGVSAEATSQTELLIKSSDKQKLGQVVAEVRAFRPPEPYKGKGIQVAGEYIRRKEAKKK
jgi:large subunit ribosomal protein L6